METLDKLFPCEVIEVGGEIGFFGLQEWWLVAFTEADRGHICTRFQPISTVGPVNPLIHGQIVTETNTDPTQFLYTLASWFHRPEDRSIRDRMVAKANELARINNIVKPGYVDGRHFSTYVEDVKQLKRENRLQEAESILVRLADAARAECAISGTVLPTFYEQHLGIVRRKLARQ